MLDCFTPFRDLRFTSLLLRMLFALLCGGVIGLERSYKNRPAGFRTHILVCIGATAASVTGIYLYLNAQLPTDISRLGAQVVSGLGFIGAGTIIVTKKNTVKGLTTAAGLWASGIIGLAIGAGFYEGALVCTALILVTETLFAVFGKRIGHAAEFKIILHYRDKETLDAVMRACKDRRLAILNLQVEGALQADETVYTAAVTLLPRKNVDRDALLLKLRPLPGVLDVYQA